MYMHACVYICAGTPANMCACTHVYARIHTTTPPHHHTTTPPHHHTTTPPHHHTTTPPYHHTTTPPHHQMERKSTLEKHLREIVPFLQWLYEAGTAETDDVRRMSLLPPSTRMATSRRTWTEHSLSLSLSVCVCVCVYVRDVCV